MGGNGVLDADDVQGLFARIAVLEGAQKIDRHELAKVEATSRELWAYLVADRRLLEEMSLKLQQVYERLGELVIESKSRREETTEAATSGRRRR